MSRPPGVDDFEFAECWCQGDMVLVRPEDIRAGLTGSCGEDWCGPEFGSAPLSFAVRNCRSFRDSLLRELKGPRDGKVRGRWSAPTAEAPT